MDLLEFLIWSSQLFALFCVAFLASNTIYELIPTTPHDLIAYFPEVNRTPIRATAASLALLYAFGQSVAVCGCRRVRQVQYPRQDSFVHSATSAL